MMAAYYLTPIYSSLEKKGQLISEHKKDFLLQRLDHP